MSDSRTSGSPAGEVVTLASPGSNVGEVINQVPATPLPPSKAASHWRRTARRLSRDPVGVAAIVYLLVVMVVAVGASWITKHDPNYGYFANQFEGPSREFWLGTDNLGRDTFARLAYGARISMQISIMTAALSTLIAIPIGLISGYWSRGVDVVVMRITDALLSVPPLVLALAIAATLGSSIRNMVLALTVVVVPGMVRLVRAQVLAVKEEGYVDASKAIGTRSFAILARRVLPHVLSPLMVQISIILGTILVVEASLSYLGLGPPPPDASWGKMLEEGFGVMATDSRLILVPSIAIALTTLAFNALGDSLREALQGAGVQPRKRGDVLGTTTTRREPAPAGQNGDSDGQAADHRALLSIRDLTIGFDTPSGQVQVVDTLSLDVRRGEIVGLVGESGCGKTVTAMSILRLLPSPPARILSGEVLFEGRDLQRLRPRELRKIRGQDISMVFQDPLASLNPAFTIGDQIVEAQRLHRDVSRSAARKRAAELLDLVGIPDGKRRLDDFPHTFSGGMRQRALIAMALANDPKLLIADEPTTALDVTVQAQIVELIAELKEELGMSVLFVTHDLGVVRDLCDRVAVMYAGQAVEQSTVDELFTVPMHPYSGALLRSRPKVGAGLDHLPSIPGVVPTPDAMPEGCRFHERCDHATDACSASPVEFTSLDGQRGVRCLRHTELDLHISIGDVPTGDVPADGDGATGAGDEPAVRSEAVQP